MGRRDRLLLRATHPRWCQRRFGLGRLLGGGCDACCMNDIRISNQATDGRGPAHARGRARARPRGRRAGGGLGRPGPVVGSLDDVIRPRQQRRWDREAERVGGLEIDDELELGWLLDGKIGRVGPFRILSAYIAAVSLDDPVKETLDPPRGIAASVGIIGQILAVLRCTLYADPVETVTVRTANVPLPFRCHSVSQTDLFRPFASTSTMRQTSDKSGKGRIFGGDPGGIRTRDLDLERVASWARLDDGVSQRSIPGVQCGVIRRGSRRARSGTGRGREQEEDRDEDDHQGGRVDGVEVRRPRVTGLRACSAPGGRATLH
jgi:hypothetical protein